MCMHDARHDRPWDSVAICRTTFHARTAILEISQMPVIDEKSLLCRIYIASIEGL